MFALLLAATAFTAPPRLAAVSTLAPPPRTTVRVDTPRVTTSVAASAAAQRSVVVTDMDETVTHAAQLSIFAHTRKKH